MEAKKLNIIGVNVDNISYDRFLSVISESIDKKNKVKISYANAHTLVEIASNNKLKKLIDKFDVFHPDGIGIFLASKFLYGKKGLKKRLVGSDFYCLLIEKGIEKNWKFYFFGHDITTLNKISSNNPHLNIVGLEQGYAFQSENIITGINNSKPDILIVGLGFPLQEQWISDNFDKINSSVILSAGGGIKIFSGTKVRGPVIIQKLGLEWLVRLINEPGRLWKRYIIGIPNFIFHVIKFKIKLIFVK